MKCAGVQMDVRIGEIDHNLDRITGYLRETHALGAKLTVFPECAVTGYCFGSLEEAIPFAESIPGPSTNRIAEVCAELNVFAVTGMLEADGEHGVFNAAVLVGPDGVVGSYRKIHLPWLGVDRFSTFGDRPFAVHHTGEARVGMNICYDSAFPESSRILSLAGADLIALPTNWPPGAECVAANAIATRALENGVYYMAINRVGEERGVQFIGMSRICDPSGRTLASAEHSDETVLYADIDLERARRKCTIRVPREHAIDRFADRRPEMYAPLTAPHSLPRPGRDVDV